MLTPKKTISFINKKTEFLTQNNIHFCTTVAFKQGNFGGSAILTQPCTEPYTKNWQADYYSTSRYFSFGSKTLQDTWSPTLFQSSHPKLVYKTITSAKFWRGILISFSCLCISHSSLFISTICHGSDPKQKGSHCITIVLVVITCSNFS